MHFGPFVSDWFSVRAFVNVLRCTILARRGGANSSNFEKGHLMRRAGGIVSLTGIAVAIALATPFDSPLGSLRAGWRRRRGRAVLVGRCRTALHDVAVLRGRRAFLAILRARSDQHEERREARCGVERSHHRQQHLQSRRHRRRDVRPGRGRRARRDRCGDRQGDLAQGRRRALRRARDELLGESRSIRPPVHLPAARRRHRRQCAEW